MCCVIVARFGFCLSSDNQCKYRSSLCFLFDMNFSRVCNHFKLKEFCFFFAFRQTEQIISLHCLDFCIQKHFLNCCRNSFFHKFFEWHKIYKIYFIRTKKPKWDKSKSTKRLLRQCFFVVLFLVAVFMPFLFCS